MTKVANSMLAAVAAAVVVAPAWAWAQQQPAEPYRYGYGPHMMGWGGGWYGMILGPLFMIIVLVAVIAIVALLVRWVAGPWHWAPPSHHAPPERTPLDILKERYARGEIETQEFEERRRVLGK